MDELHWRFPDNGYGQENGLDTSDMETFKRDSDGGLAREICQNSIDANNHLNPTKIEFKSFDLPASCIPGIDELRDRIKDCYNYKSNDEKESTELLNMYNTINLETIKCLRISDFNTVGLKGIKENKRGTPFFNLTKGSGTSNKGSGSGGSKGIGKFATFVASTTNTVFYSTYTEDGEVGYIGITKLRSVPLPDDEEKMTMGIGYFSSNDKNAPILKPLDLDPNFNRKSCGTDIFIIGFNDTENWKANITYKILDSFMASFIFNGLEVEVDDVRINKENLNYIIKESDILKSKKDNERAIITAQYELLTDDQVQRKEITIGKDNIVKLYVKSYDSKDENLASKRCEIIRYPYMKIKDYRKQTYLPYSALCIIENNRLNELLRKIENPEHTEWQFDRLKNENNVIRKETNKMYREMKDAISNFIVEVLKKNNGESTDLSGAGEYLPFFEEEGMYNQENIIKDEAKISPIKRNVPHISKPTIRDDKGEGMEFGKGSDEGSEDGIRLPKEKEGKESKPSSKYEHKPNDNNKGSSNGEKPIVKKAPLGGIRYRNIYNKNKNEYNIVFTSLYDKNDCELAIQQVGEASDTYNIDIISANINGHECQIEDGRIKGICIKKGEKYNISYKIEEKERFAIEVVLCV